MSTDTVNVKIFLRTIIRPALLSINKHSTAAEQLMLGTAIQESDLRNLKQIGGGPGRGYFQMEKKTHDDIWKTYLTHKPDLRAKLLVLGKISHGLPDSDLMLTNHLYAAGMARTRYARLTAPLPPTGHIREMAAYWSLHYNTKDLQENEDQFILKWKLYDAGSAF